MAKSAFQKPLHAPEILVLVVFVLYLIFPVDTPSFLNPYIESPLGVIVLFVIIIALFLYSHPVIGILFVFVAYTLLRRSSEVKPTVSYVQHTKPEYVKMADAQKEINEGTPRNEKPKKAEIKKKQPVTLEEEVIMQKAPVGVSEKLQIVKTSFKPVSSNIHGGSPL